MAHQAVFVEGIVAGRCFTHAVLAVVLACVPGDEGQPDALKSENQEVAVATACRMPIDRTTVRAQGGAILETWEMPLEDVLTDELPGESAFLEY